MSESSLKSIYSIFIFLLAFSIINFYAKKAKEEKRFKLEQQKLREMKVLETKEVHESVVRDMWVNMSTCKEIDRFSCNKFDAFCLDQGKT
jgi:regulator of PEP synthase PpsR (kinase-PPPase family)